jgi:hypothetical protein
MSLTNSPWPGKTKSLPARPGRVWLETSRLGTGKSLNFLYSVQLIIPELEGVGTNHSIYLDKSVVEKNNIWVKYLLESRVVWRGGTGLAHWFSLMKKFLPDCCQALNVLFVLKCIGQDPSANFFQGSVLQTIHKVKAI